jgi:hypothetical protein
MAPPTIGTSPFPTSFETELTEEENRIQAASNVIYERLKLMPASAARLQFSPALLSAIGSSEVQIYYASSSYSPPEFETFNAPPKQQRTMQFRINVMLRDLRSHESCYRLLALVEKLLKGVQPLGEQFVRTNGSIYFVDESFVELEKDGIWLYTVLLAFDILQNVEMGVF